MLKFIKGERGRRPALIRLLILAILFGNCAAYAADYAGNIYISSGVTFDNAYLISNNSPVPANSHALRTGDDMPTGSNYASNPDVVRGDGSHWTRFNIVATTVSSVYVLLVKGAQYSVQGPYALGTNTPTDHDITSATFYNAGTPPAANVTLTLNGLTYPAYDGIVSSGIAGVAGGYQATGSKHALFNVTGGTDGQKDGTLASPAVVSGAGNLSNYHIADSGNKLYRVQMAYVNWFTDANENWGESNNLKIPAGGGPVISVQPPITLSLKHVLRGFGINSIALPFPTPEVYAVVTANGIPAVTKMVTLQNLIDAIQSLGAKVTAAGWWGKDDQQAYGYAFKTDGTVVATRGTPAKPADVLLESGVGYQVSVDRDASVTFYNYSNPVLP